MYVRMYLCMYVCKRRAENLELDHTREFDGKRVVVLLAVVIVVQILMFFFLWIC